MTTTTAPDRDVLYVVAVEALAASEHCANPACDICPRGARAVVDAVLRELGLDGRVGS